MRPVVLEHDMHLEGEVAPVRIDRADDLNERGTINICGPEEKVILTIRMSLKKMKDMRCHGLQRSEGVRHSKGCSPMALDCNVCAVSCLDTCHVRTTVLHATNKSDLLPCKMFLRKDEGKLRTELTANEAMGRVPVCWLRRCEFTRGVGADMQLYRRSDWCNQTLCTHILLPVELDSLLAGLVLLVQHQCCGRDSNTGALGRARTGPDAGILKHTGSWFYN